MSLAQDGLPFLFTLRSADHILLVCFVTIAMYRLLVWRIFSFRCAKTKDELSVIQVCMYYLLKAR